jgi:hypothetical protein
VPTSPSTTPAASASCASTTRRLGARCRLVFMLVSTAAQFTIDASRFGPVWRLFVADGWRTTESLRHPAPPHSAR